MAAERRESRYDVTKRSGARYCRAFPSSGTERLGVLPARSGEHGELLSLAWTD